MTSLLGQHTQCTEILANHPAYPKRFDKLDDPPAKLWVVGQIPVQPMVAIVGSRKTEPRMHSFAASLAVELCRRGFCVVSGGALGIDSAAHRGALDADGVTMAIIGSGLDNIYPRANKNLFNDIIKKGAVISEFHPSVPPTRWTFPRRNRLVASVASAVVVVQAANRSGALITAQIAKNIGVPVGAVPGTPHDLLSRGCNSLIRGGTPIVENVDDIVNLVRSDSFMCQLNLPQPSKRVMETTVKVPSGLSEDEQAVWDLLGAEPVHVDELAAATGLEISRIGAAVLNLELLGFAVDRGGRNVVRMQ